MSVQNSLNLQTNYFLFFMLCLMLWDSSILKLLKVLKAIAYLLLAWPIILPILLDLALHDFTRALLAVSFKCPPQVGPAISEIPESRVSPATSCCCPPPMMRMLIKQYINKYFVLIELLKTLQNKKVYNSFISKELLENFLFQELCSIISNKNNLLNKIILLQTNKQTVT